jgi:hypothetical protein
MSKREFKSPILTSGPGLSIADIRNLARNEPVIFVNKVQDLVAQDKIRLTDLKDLRTLYKGLADVPVTVTMNINDMQRTVSASAFPILVGTTVVKAINDSYLAVPTIGQDLVTDIEDNKKVTVMAAVHALDKQKDEVKELEDFPEIGASEETVQIRHRKNGRKLSISAETILENDLADIVSRVNAVGEIAADWQEEQTLERVTDHYGSGATPAEPYAYRPEGTGTQLYNATANNPGTRAPSGTRKTSNAFADETDLDNARTVLVAMKNNRDKRITVPWSETILLCPDALLGAVSKTFNSELVPGVENELSNYGPRGRWHLPPERIMSSSKMDDLSTSAWYLGVFRRQFKRKWKMRMEYVTLGQDTQAYLNSQVAFQARVAWDMEVGATDYVYVVQNLSGTTAPVDE